MKGKKGFKISIIIIFIFIIASFLIIQSWTTTSHGKLSTKLAILLKYNKYFNYGPIKEKNINEIRQTLDKDSAKLSGKPIPFPNIKDINISTPKAQIPVRIYTPKTSNNLPIIVYSHGGAWVSGGLDTHDNICRKLSKNTDAVVVSVGYRLAPENPFPAALNDIYNVLLWVYKNAESINGNANKIAVAGDSSGGNLSAAVCHMARDKSGPKILCQVLIYPPTNIYELNSNSWSYFANDFNLNKEDMEKYISLYVPSKEDRRNPYASPLLAKNFNSLPPALIITAEFDGLRDEGETYGKKLKNAGVQVIVTRYKGVVHGFIEMDKVLKESDGALNEIYSYLNKKF